MSEEWTDEDEAELKGLRRRKAKYIRDNQPGGRKHKYTPRGLTNRDKKTEA